MATITMSFSDYSSKEEPITASLTTTGGGTADHFADTFKAFCVACGFHEDTADEMLDEFREMVEQDEWVEEVRYDEAREEVGDADTHPRSESEEEDNRNPLDVARGKW